MRSKQKNAKEKQAHRRRPKGNTTPANPYDGAEVEIREEVDVDEFIKMVTR